MISEFQINIKKLFKLLIYILGFSQVPIKDHNGKVICYVMPTMRESIVYIREIDKDKKE